MMDWKEKVEFAWLGQDENKQLALFYISYEYLPKDILEYYTKKDYDDFTSFILDTLDEYSEVVSEEEWASYDARKGIYVYKYIVKDSLYKLVAFPKKPLLSSKFEVLNANSILTKKLTYGEKYLKL